MAKRKVKPVEPPKSNILKAAVAKIISKINLNSILLALLTLLGSIFTYYINDKQDKITSKQKQAADWRARSDSARNAQSIFLLHHIDSLHNQTMLTLKKKK